MHLVYTLLSLVNFRLAKFTALAATTCILIFRMKFPKLTFTYFASCFSP